MTSSASSGSRLLMMPAMRCAPLVGAARRLVGLQHFAQRGLDELARRAAIACAARSARTARRCGARAAARRRSSPRADGSSLERCRSQSRASRRSGSDDGALRDVRRAPARHPVPRPRRAPSQITSSTSFGGRASASRLRAWPTSPSRFGAGREVGGEFVHQPVERRRRNGAERRRGARDRAQIRSDRSA